MGLSASTTSTMSTASSTSAAMHCSRHRAVSTTMRCDRCYQPFCRDCLVSRFITSRSSVWLCRACARSGSPYTGYSGSSGASGGLIRHPRSVAGRDLRYWLVAAGAVVLLLLAASQQGLLPF
jgi:hypothetical protein